MEERRLIQRMLTLKAQLQKRADLVPGYETRASRLAEQKAKDAVLSEGEFEVALFDEPSDRSGSDRCAPPPGEAVPSQPALEGLGMQRLPLFTFSNGDQYDGEWLAGRMHGFGHYTYSKSGNTYVGNYVDHLKEGYGVFTYAAGTQYKGYYRKGQRCGQGSMTYANGDRYAGEYAGNVFAGSGVFTYASGDHYDGEWVGGVPQIAAGCLVWAICVPAILLSPVLHCMLCR